MGRPAVLMAAALALSALALPVHAEGIELPTCAPQELAGGTATRWGFGYSINGAWFWIDCPGSPTYYLVGDGTVPWRLIGDRYDTVRNNGTSQSFIDSVRRNVKLPRTDPRFTKVNADAEAHHAMCAANNVPHTIGGC